MREEGRIKPKTHRKSKAHSIDSLKSHVTMLETSMSVVQDTLDNLEVTVDGLEGEYADITVATKALIQNKGNIL